jgi:recombination protein RecT
VTTVTQASKEQAKDLQLINWLRAQQDDLAMAAASHLKPATIVRVAQGALRKDPKLMAAAIANPQSLIHCLLDAARLGHEAGTDQYWLIPFGSEVTGIEGYKGIIERMYRAGGVSSVHAEVVRQRDAYRSMGSRTPPVHEYDEFADPEDRGPLRGVYAYAVMSDGLFSQVMRMGRAEVMKHKAMSRGSDRSDSPWKCWEEAMWKKVPLGGLEPYVPTSSEWLIARAQAAATASARIAAPGWAPPVQAAAAPLQLVASEVVEPGPAVNTATGEVEPPPSRPARRRQAATDPSPVPGATPPASAARPPQQGAGEALPPLPGEEEITAPVSGGKAVAEESAHAEASGPGAADEAHGTVTTAQITAIWTILTGVFGFTRDEKDQARLVCAHIVQRDLASTTHLSKREAGTILDELSTWQYGAEQESQHPRDYMTALMISQDPDAQGEVPGGE